MSNFFFKCYCWQINEEWIFQHLHDFILIIWRGQHWCCCDFRVLPISFFCRDPLFWHRPQRGEWARPYGLEITMASSPISSLSLLFYYWCIPSHVIWIKIILSHYLAISKIQLQCECGSHVKKRHYFPSLLSARSFDGLFRPSFIH